LEAKTEAIDKHKDEETAEHDEAVREVEKVEEAEKVDTIDLEPEEAKVGISDIIDTYREPKVELFEPTDEKVATIKMIDGMPFVEVNGLWSGKDIGLAVRRFPKVARLNRAKYIKIKEQERRRENV